MDLSSIVVPFARMERWREKGRPVPGIYLDDSAQAKTVLETGRILWISSCGEVQDLEPCFFDGRGVEYEGVDKALTATSIISSSI